MKRTDLSIAQSYIDKAKYAKEKGLEFTISFNQYKRLVTRKKCEYTSLPFDTSPQHKLTLDRIDNSKGYIPGNVVAICYFANQFKSIWENPTNQVTLELAKLITNQASLYFNHNLLQNSTLIK